VSRDPYGADTDCTCPWDEHESITAFNRDCPQHGHLAPPRKTIEYRWCQGSSEPVIMLDKRSGNCRYCGHVVPSKYGHASVHLPDGSIPRE
jgi:hypothetical protein